MLPPPLLFRDGCCRAVCPLPRRTHGGGGAGTRKRGTPPPGRVVQQTRARPTERSPSTTLHATYRGREARSRSWQDAQEDHARGWPRGEAGHSYTLRQPFQEHHPLRQAVCLAPPSSMFTHSRARPLSATSTDAAINDNVHEKWALTCSDRLWARSTRVPPTKRRACPPPPSTGGTVLVVQNIHTQIWSAQALQLRQLPLRSGT